MELTQWTVLKIHHKKQFAYRTYHNSQWKMIDLNIFNFNNNSDVETIKLNYNINDNGMENISHLLHNNNNNIFKSNK